MKLSLATAGLSATLLFLAAPASAAVTTVIQVKDSQVPTTAARFSEHSGCDDIAARRGMDAWHFVLPANRYDFVTVTARFAERRDARVPDFVAAAPGRNGFLAQRGNATGKHAYLFAPAGRWLIGATATVTGKGKKPTHFVLSHTCPTRPAKPGKPSPSTPASPPTPDEPATPASPSESPSPSVSVLPSEPLTDSPTPWPTDDTPAPSNGGGDDSDKDSDGDGGGLPITGIALLGLLGSGGLLAAGGVVLRTLAHRRRATDTMEPVTE